MPIPSALSTHLDSAGRISKMPVKLGRKLTLALGLLEDFQVGVDYTEAEVNQILNRYVDDFALIRRMLVERGELGRERDCSRYWRNPAKPSALAQG